jgi:hypothetical protein
VDQTAPQGNAPARVCRLRPCGECVQAVDHPGERGEVVAGGLDEVAVQQVPDVADVASSLAAESVVAGQ